MSPDIKAAVTWLKTWHPQGPWAIAEIDPSSEPRRVPVRVFTDEDALYFYLEEKTGVVNLYFIPNQISPSITTTPTKDEIQAITCLDADLDLPKEGPHSAPNEENFQRLLDKIEALVPAPTVIIFSGGGYQAFWVFPKPISAREHADRIEAISKAIAKTLDSDAVQNINRLMRLPGTINIPNEKKRARGRQPALAEVVSADWGRTWDPITGDTPKYRPGYAAPESSDDDETDTALPNKANGEFRSLVDLPAKWQKLVKSGDARDYDNDRSRLTAGFISIAIRRGWGDEDILPFLTDPTYGISGHCLDNGGRPAAQRQITRLRERIKDSWEYNPMGQIAPASPKNIRLAMGEFGIKLSYNTFAERGLVNGAGPLRDLDDTFISDFRIRTHDRFGFMPQKDVLHDLVSYQSRLASFHPVRDYLAEMAPTWDGTSRLETWLIDYAEAEDNEFIRCASRLILLAAVRRARQPGCKFDQMVVLISPQQGTGKSKALAALSPNVDWFTDSFPLHADDKKAIEQLSGKWIVECAELSGMKKADVEPLKAMISRQIDRSRLAYGHFAMNVPRQCVFFASTNSTAFLQDRENRRFWPVVITRFNIQALQAIRDQLWAEAAQAEPSASIEMPEELWPLAGEHQDAARYGDTWTDQLALYLTNMTGRVSTLDTWKILGKPINNHGPTENGRLSDCMTELGWERKLSRIDGIPQRCFIKGENESERQQAIYVHVDPIDRSITVSHAISPREAEAYAEGRPHPQSDIPF
jgi:predicted P-loop ATPase